MTYADGQQVRLGDLVALGGETGEVVAVFDDGAFAEDFSPDAWAGLTGFLARFEAYGLIHYETAEEDLALTARRPG